MLDLLSFLGLAFLPGSLHSLMKGSRIIERAFPEEVDNAGSRNLASEVFDQRRREV